VRPAQAPQEASRSHSGILGDAPLIRPSPSSPPLTSPTRDSSRGEMQLRQAHLLTPSRSIHASLRQHPPRFPIFRGLLCVRFFLYRHSARPSTRPSSPTYLPLTRRLDSCERVTHHINQIRHIVTRGCVYNFRPRPPDPGHRRPRRPRRHLLSPTDAPTGAPRPPGAPQSPPPPVLLTSRPLLAGDTTGTHSTPPPLPPVSMPPLGLEG
jgi:hypothetical protein